MDTSATIGGYGKNGADIKRYFCYAARQWAEWLARVRTEYRSMVSKYFTPRRRV
jgi:hypothetical protein